MSGKRRIVKKKNRSKGENKIRNAKSHEYNGIKFRSRLEVYIYKQLLANGIGDFDYEQHKFTLIEPFVAIGEFYESYNKKIRGTDKKEKGFGESDNKVRPMTYMPDFVCINKDTKTGWIIEGKGFANDQWPIKFKLFKQYLKDNGYNISYYLPNDQKNVLKSIQSIKDKFYKQN